jgi:hypothetical protein
LGKFPTTAKEKYNWKRKLQLGKKITCNFRSNCQSEVLQGIGIVVVE